MDLIAIQYLVALFAAIAGFFAALKPVRRFLLKCWQKTFGRRKLRRHLERKRLEAEALERYEAIVESNKLILAELRPNGDSSMRDAVDRIEYRQAGFDAFLSAQLNVLDVAIFRTDAEGKVKYNNRKHQHLTGFSAGEVSGDGWVNVIHPIDRDMVFHKWKQAVESGIEFSEDIRYVSPEGEEYKVHVNAYREMDAHGNIRGFLGLVSPLEGLEKTCPHIDRCIAIEKINGEEGKP